MKVTKSGIRAIAGRGEYTVEDYVAKITEVVALDPKRLEEHMYKFSEQKSWISRQWAIAAKVLARKKSERDRVHAERSRFHREKLSASGERITENMLEATVLTDKVYIAALGEYHDWIEKEALLRTAREDASEKCNIMIMLASIKKAEKQ